MEKGNVLVIGNSGVGKSTLINAVLGEDRAETSWGNAGTTRELKLYEVDCIPFRLIDTVGFEPTWLKEKLAINSVNKWSRESAKKGKEDTGINIIWFCVDGTANKLFIKALDNLSRATKMWESIPVVVVITKSYSEPDRAKNIEMVHNAFAKQKRAKNVCKVVPVVASTFTLNDTAYAPPYGINELIDFTNEIMPEGIKANQKDLSKFKLIRKRSFAHSVVGAATLAGVVVGAVPVPFSDALILGPTEFAMVSAIAGVYQINKDEQLKQLINTMIEAGTIGIAAKTALSALKAVPGINIAASAANAVVAGVFIALLGEVSIYIFEQIYLGEKSIADLDWVEKIIEGKFSNQFFEKLNEAFMKIGDNDDKQSIAQTIVKLFFTSKN
jgi:uncharacterized protein (DUF697 family)/GTP-binding protein EngB required for normal cell division